jgi:lysophospholipase L1-like esterase
VPAPVAPSPAPPPPEPPVAAPDRPPAVPLAPGESARTACQAVVHIGDSLSVGMTSPSYIGDPTLRLDAQYERVGVALPYIDASGGRSVVETLGSQLNGETVARRFREAGFQGCWVVALGTNDTANVAVGSGVDRRARVERILAVAAGDPVLWVDTRTLVGSGAYAAANMVAWNETLAQAEVDHPNLVVYPWSTVVQDGWFVRDGIHLTSAGYVEQARGVADALVAAFPG